MRPDVDVTTLANSLSELKIILMFFESAVNDKARVAESQTGFSKSLRH